jgi:hypothetical protein
MQHKCAIEAVLKKVFQGRWLIGSGETALDKMVQILIGWVEVKFDKPLLALFVR